MRVVFPAFSLAVVHIAGSNAAVVPVMALLIGNGIFATVFMAYMIFGAMVAGMSAWIGLKTGRELTAAVKRLFGVRGRKVLASAVLAVSLPASALTGGYFSGKLLENLIGIPYMLAVPLCIAGYCLLSVGYGRELLRLSNYVALLFVPATGVMLIMMLMTSPIVPCHPFASFGDISWPLVSALIGYSACGMRSALVVEAGSHFAAQNYTSVYLAILAKIFEGFITLLLAYLTLIGGEGGFMPLAILADKVFGSWWAAIFSGVLLCVFLNTMVPAMLVNAKQLSVLTRLPLWRALALAGLMIWGGSFIPLNLMLLVLSGAGLMMSVVIFYIVYCLHNQSANK